MATDDKIRRTNELVFKHSREGYKQSMKQEPANAPARGAVNPFFLTKTIAWPRIKLCLKDAPVGAGKLYQYGC